MHLFRGGATSSSPPLTPMDDLTAIKQYPLPELFASWGVKLRQGQRGGGQYYRGRCPFHEDRDPSLSIIRYPDGMWHWKCHSGCGHGTIIDALMLREGLAKAAAIARAREVTGVQAERRSPVAVGAGRVQVSSAAAAVAEPVPVASREALDDSWYAALGESVERLAQQRSAPAVLSRYGISLEAAGELFLGLDEQGGLVIPIFGAQKQLVNLKRRAPRPEEKPRYRYLVTGVGATPWVSPNWQPEAQHVLVVEGEMNAIAAHVALRELNSRVAVIGMPGAESSLSIDDTLEARNIYIYADDDAAGNRARQRWAEQATQQGAIVAQMPPLPEAGDYAEVLASMGASAFGRYLQSEVDELKREAQQPAADPLGFGLLDLTQAPPRPLWLVQDFFQANKVNLLAAYGGVGKSSLAAHLTVCVLSSQDFLGRMTYPVEDVYYIDYEDDSAAFRLNLMRSAAGLGVTAADLQPRINYIAASTDPRWRGPFGGMVERLVGYFSSKPSGRRLVVIDSFEAAMQIESVKSGEAMAAMAGLKAIANSGVTVLALDHLPKVGKGQSKDDLMPSGSVQKTNQSRAVVKVEDVTPSGYGAGKSILKCVAVKINNAKRFDPFGIEREISSDKAIYRLCDLPEQPQDGRPNVRLQEARELALNTLRSGAMARAQLISELQMAGIARTTAYRTVEALEELELIETFSGTVRLRKGAN